MARYIDADAFIKEVVKIQDLRRLSTATIGEALDRTPTADVVEVKHGKNISDSGFLCSICSFGDFGGFHGYEPNYCPNCGAKMWKEDEDDIH